MSRAEVEQGRVIRSFMWVAVIGPAIVTLLGISIALSWRGELPDPIATHWGVGGQVDGFGSLTTLLVFLPLLSFGLPAILAASVFPSLRRGDRGPHLRLLGAVALAISVLITVLLVGSLAIQRGLDDAVDAPGIGGVLLWSYGFAVLAAAIGWFAQPAQDLRREPTAPGAQVALAPGEKVVWMHTVHTRRWFTVFMIAIAVMLGAVGVAAIPESGWAGWLIIGCGLLIAVLVATMTVVSVRVSDEGLTVRGVLGWPVTRVPLDDVVSAEVAMVRGLADFGGWGWRWRPSAQGIILRDGEAIWVKRASGKDLAVSVDDAATGAGLLTALVARARVDGKG